MTGKFSNVLGGTLAFHDGNEIPLIGLGISRIVGQESLDVAVRAALEAGYRMFDTAHIYKNEAELGNALKKFLPEFGLTREDVFITTKVPLTNADTLANTVRIVKESLEKLQTSYVDLLLVHFPRDRDVGLDDDYEINKAARKVVYQQLERFQQEGVARSIGVSNYEVYHLVELFEYAKIKPVLNQCEFTPRFTRKTLLHFCRQNSIVFQAWSSLCWGDKEVLASEPVQALVKKYNVSPQTVLYAFATSHGVSIIPKSATPANIRNNLHEVAKVKFTREELASLDALDQNKNFCPVPTCSWNCL